MLSLYNNSSQSFLTFCHLSTFSLQANWIGFPTTSLYLLLEIYYFCFLTSHVLERHSLWCFHYFYCLFLFLFPYRFIQWLLINGRCALKSSLFCVWFVHHKLKTWFLFISLNFNTWDQPSSISLLCLQSVWQNVECVQISCLLLGWLLFWHNCINNVNNKSLIGKVIYVQYGKATNKTDVFNYGVAILKVACGRRPIEREPISLKMVSLVDWIWGYCILKERSWSSWYKVEWWV